MRLSFTFSRYKKNVSRKVIEVDEVLGFVSSKKSLKDRGIEKTLARPFSLPDCDWKFTSKISRLEASLQLQPHPLTLPKFGVNLTVVPST